MATSANEPGQPDTGGSAFAPDKVPSNFDRLVAKNPPLARRYAIRVTRRAVDFLEQGYITEAADLLQAIAPKLSGLGDRMSNMRDDPSIAEVAQQNLGDLRRLLGE